MLYRPQPARLLSQPQLPTSSQHMPLRKPYLSMAAILGPQPLTQLMYMYTTSHELPAPLQTYSTLANGPYMWHTHHRRRKASSQVAPATLASCILPNRPLPQCAPPQPLKLMPRAWPPHQLPLPCCIPKHLQQSVIPVRPSAAMR
jgi:hypothetical protein